MFMQTFWNIHSVCISGKNPAIFSWHLFETFILYGNPYQKFLENIPRFSRSIAMDFVAALLLCFWKATNASQITTSKNIDDHPILFCRALGRASNIGRPREIYVATSQFLWRNFPKKKTLDFLSFFFAFVLDTFRIPEKLFENSM